jgi:hypothetical protein
MSDNSIILSQYNSSQLPKDLICYLATFIDPVNLVNFFQVSKLFNDNTNKNCSFWRLKLLRDFNFSYDSVYNLSIIQQHYRILFNIQIYGISNLFLECETFKMAEFSTLHKYLIANKEKLTLRCEYIFLRGDLKGRKCDKMGQRYGRYIFCSSCTKKRPVQQMLNN